MLYVVVVAVANGERHVLGDGVVMLNVCVFVPWQLPMDNEIFEAVVLSCSMSVCLFLGSCR